MLKIPVLFPMTEQEKLDIPSPGIQVFLYLIMKKEYEHANAHIKKIAKTGDKFPHTSGFKVLIEKGWVVAPTIITDSKQLGITSKTRNFFKEAESSKVKKTKIEASIEIESWIDEFREIFSVKVGKKGSKGECVRKMSMFFEENPQFANKDLVIEAAKEYIKSLKGVYTYMRQADYFIKKKDMENDRITSDLEVYCEALKNKGVTIETITNQAISPTSGRSVI